MEGIDLLLVFLPSTDPSWKFDSVQEMRIPARDQVTILDSRSLHEAHVKLRNEPTYIL